MEWQIVVVDRIPKPFPPVRQLVEIGVPVSVATRYEKVRREMSPAGLKRWLKRHKN